MMMVKVRWRYDEGYGCDDDDEGFLVLDFYLVDSRLLNDGASSCMAT